MLLVVRAIQCNVLDRADANGVFLSFSAEALEHVSRGTHSNFDAVAKQRLGKSQST